MTEPLNIDLERQLATSKEVFRLVVESICDYAIFMISTSGNILTWNEGAQRIFGYEGKEIIGKNFEILFKVEERERNHPQHELDIAIKAGRYEEEGWRIKNTGESIRANMVLTPIYENAELIGFAQITRDLTERNSAEQSEQVFRLLVSSVRDCAIFMLDPEGNVMTWNEGAERINGYKASEIIGKHFSSFYTQESKDNKHPDMELKVARENGSYEEEGWRVRKDGTLIWASVIITAVFDHGHFIGYAKITRDLSERKVAERREEVFKLLVSGVMDYAIFMLDPDGNVMTWNEGAERIKGYSSQEIIGQHFSIFCTKESQKRQHPQNELEIAKTTGRYEEEGWRVRKDGSLLWANVTITAIWEDNNLIGFAKVTRDLTQRLLADQEREMNAKALDETNAELRRALEVKSRFLSTISHEVRTPMAGIIGMTEMLNLEDLGADNNKILQSVFESSQRLLQLLNNLLESARMEAGEVVLHKSKFPLRSVFGDVRQLVWPDASKKQLRIIGNVGSDIPEFVVGDELKIRQILLNLAHNAVKFTSSGEINISAEHVYSTKELVALKFTVSDTGVGIKPSERDNLFEPFTQAHDPTKKSHGGAGLGLSITKHLVELMGGTIGFESEHGKGSKFWVQIPFEKEIAA